MLKAKVRSGVDHPNKPSGENTDGENASGDWQERSQQREGSHHSAEQAVNPKQLALLAALNSGSREAVAGVKQGMQRFREPSAKAGPGRKKTEYAQESYAERGEEMRRQAGLHSAVVDHDALTNAQGGLPPIPGAKVAPSALVAPKTKRTTSKGRGR